MKKFSYYLMTLLMSVMFMACSGCNQPKADEPVDTLLTDSTSVVLIPAASVENFISTDRQAMYLKFGDNYRWYETDIRLPFFLDEEDVICDPTIVVNIFQSVVEKGNGADTYVWKFQHFPDGTVNVDSIQGFWIENFPLNEAVIKFDYSAAFDRMMEVNFPKPHSRNVVLRNPVGPIGVNAQWIFGNIKEQIWIDAATGDATNSNPAFPEEKGFKMPLGEWP